MNRKIIGVTPEEFFTLKTIIKGVFSAQTSYQFFCFGSRVTGGFEKTSDLDVLIYNKADIPAEYKKVAELKHRCDVSSLPFIVDFSDYHWLDKDFYALIKDDLVEIDFK